MEKEVVRGPNWQTSGNALENLIREYMDKKGFEIRVCMTGGRAAGKSHAARVIRDALKEVMLPNQYKLVVLSRCAEMEHYKIEDFGGDQDTTSP